MSSSWYKVSVVSELTIELGGPGLEERGHLGQCVLDSLVVLLLALLAHLLLHLLGAARHALGAHPQVRSCNKQRQDVSHSDDRKASKPDSDDGSSARRGSGRRKRGAFTWPRDAPAPVQCAAPSD